MSEDNNELLPDLDLRLTESNPDDLYDRAPCGYCSCLPDGTLVRLNQTLLGWLGYRREELVARRCLQELFTIGGQLHYETHGAPLLLLQDQVRELSYSLRCKDGRMRPVLLNAVLVRTAEGQPLVIQATLFDITERRKYEQELLRTKQLAEEQREQLARANEQLVSKNEQLTRINADLDSFVYTASHDLKQPIDNMAGLFEELKSAATFHDPQAAPMLTMFEGALRQILSTIQGLTEVVQQQRALEQLPAEEVALQSFTEDIIRGLQPMYAPYATPFVLDFGAVPTLRMARSSLHSMLYNLLSNALKYAMPGRAPHIRVSTEAAGDRVVLVVQDNGRGIDLTRHSKELFQLFRRFHPDVEGSGMGLYLVNRLVHQVGGQVEVDSTVDQGTTFRIYLPR
ncbi:PAS domain-containing sensor histidine kinase [Microvirga sp. STR05]|uniref:histidine kinase n=1 Tax=Hymenobacter duratus TaxID=2771356 RepID=A0ABR8JL20_9BACT|nr:PAS domain-containing sensor histidine kinase [Hymenobacter duratus]MBD2716283.1 PAS domain-containing sensor histidine kinase [Hymenobacter duratus]MBR7951199.1 PAS domain-containing sensor histidine kinase [Microvirga sp. STR05]